MESWIEQLLPIIEEYRGGAVSFANDENEPLDGDEVDDLCKIIKTNMKILDLKPLNGQKSFGGKAQVILVGNIIQLRSFETIVAEYNTKEDIVNVFDWFSSTTAKHINSFLELYGFRNVSKKDILGGALITK